MGLELYNAESSICKSSPYTHVKQAAESRTQTRVSLLAARKAEIAALSTQKLLENKSRVEEVQENFAVSNSSFVIEIQAITSFQEQAIKEIKLEEPSSIVSGQLKIKSDTAAPNSEVIKEVVSNQPKGYLKSNIIKVALATCGIFTAVISLVTLASGQISK